MWHQLRRIHSISLRCWCHCLRRWTPCTIQLHCGQAETRPSLWSIFVWKYPINSTLQYVDLLFIPIFPPWNARLNRAMRFCPAEDVYMNTETQWEWSDVAFNCSVYDGWMSCLRPRSHKVWCSTNYYTILATLKAQREQCVRYRMALLVVSKRPASVWFPWFLCVGH